VEEMEEVMQIPCVKHGHVVLHQHPHIVQAEACRVAEQKMQAAKLDSELC